MPQGANVRVDAGEMKEPEPDASGLSTVTTGGMARYYLSQKKAYVTKNLRTLGAKTVVGWAG